MQINSTTSLNTQYVTDLQNKKSETPSTSFQDSLTNQEEDTTTVGTTSSVSAIEEPQERYHNLYTYENTKGMTNDDIDEYFSGKTEEQRNEIKSTVFIANSFSENDFANEAVFNEVKNHSSEFNSIDFFMEKSDFAEGYATLHSNAPIVAWDAWISGESPYLNAEHKARVESGRVTFGNVKFISEQAEDFLSTMTQLAKDKMEQSEGSQVYDDYKEAYDRYSRMNDTYNELVAKQAENNSVNL